MKLSKRFLGFLGFLFLGFMVSCDGLPTDISGIDITDLETISDVLTTEEPTTIDSTHSQTTTSRLTTDIPTTHDQTTVIPTTTQAPTTSEDTSHTTDMPTTLTPSYRVFFLNSQGWESVYAFTWFGEETPLGGFPGQEATQDGDSDWWFIDIDLDLENNQIGLVFSNGDIENSLQTPDVILDSPFYLYVTITGETFVTKNLAESSLTSQDIWFYNADGWTEVYAYAWVGTSRLFGNFPGLKATQDADTDWWYVSVPYAVDDIPVNIIFNNFANEETIGIVIDDRDFIYTNISGQVFDSKAAAEASLNQTSVWFYNSESWDNVYLQGLVHMSENVEDDVEISQTLMIQEDSSGWWFLPLPVDADLYDVDLVISNGDDQSAPMMTINSSYNVYMTFEGLLFSSKIDALASLDIDISHIYFYNSDGWDDVYAFAYIEAGSPLTDIWPGEQAIQEEGSDWWSIALPVDLSLDTLTIIFNNNNNGLQTLNIEIGSETHVYTTVKGESFESKAAAEASMTPAEINRIYFYNSDGWTDVYAFAYIEAGSPITPIWPGIQASQEESSDWWYVDLPIDLGVDPLTIIFNNNNNGLQTINIDIDSETHIYTTVLGQSFETKADAELSLSQTGVWFYNSESWDNVYLEGVVHMSENAEDDVDILETLMVQEGLSAWWFLPLPVDANLYDVDLLISNGDDQSAPMMTINSSDNVYMTYEGLVFSSKADALASLDIETSQIYFYNSDGWTDVYAFAYIESGNPITEIWPGDKAIQEEGSDWWYVELPVDLTVDTLTIIFNNNNNGLQTINIDIDSETHNYTTVLGQSFDSKENAEASLVNLETTKVYFYNSQAWDSVGVFAYTDNDLLLGEWPGMQATQDIENPDWWMIELPVDAVITPFHIIFNHISGGMQSGEAFIDDHQMVYVSMVGHKFETKAEVLASLFTTSTLYFYNHDYWDQVYAYVYGPSGTLLGQWPGVLMIQETISTNWWTIDLPVDLNEDDLSIIFHNGLNEQTDDISTIDANHVYITRDGDLFESMLAAESSTLHTRIWYYNSEGWDDVFATAMDEAYQSILPLTMMTKSLEDPLWWYVDVPVITGETAIDIQFFDGVNSFSTLTSIDQNDLVYVSFHGQVEASMAEIEAIYHPTTRLYFYNSDGWVDVYAFAYVDAGNPLTDLWPGNQAIQEEGSDWWYLDIPVDLSQDILTIIFNDHDPNDPQQTINIEVSLQSQVYLTVSGESFESKVDAEMAMMPVSTSYIYFYNSDGWADVYGFAYVQEGLPLTDAWPGNQAIRENDSDWWSIEIPVDLNQDVLTIIFNNHDSTNNLQTMNVTIDDPAYVYVTVHGDVFASQADAEVSLVETHRIYIYNSNLWGSVYVYASDGSGLEPLGTQPGAEAIQENGADWYYIDIAYDLLNQPLDILISDGGSGFLSTITLTNDFEIYINMNEELWQTKAMAEASLASGDLTRIHFYNSLAWDAVYAYVADQTMILPTWPGIKAKQEGNSDWWYIDIPNDTSLNSVDVTFHMGDSDQVSGVATIGTNDYVYVTMTGATFSNTLDAETSMLASTRIYYYNTEAWASVAAYVSAQDYGNLLGSWPGMQMIQEGDSDWWYIDVPVDTSMYPISMVFTNGLDIGTLSSFDLVINSLDGVYVSYYGDVFTSKTAIENEMALTTRVYFYNSDMWADISAYAYLEPGVLLTDNWPGEGLIRENPNEDWYYIDIPYDVDKHDFTIIFNNSDQGLQTNNVLLTSSTSVYVTVDGQVFASKADAEASLSSNVTTTIHFYNDEAWTAPYAYIYDEAGNVYNAWPGYPMTQDGDSDWWTIDVDLDLSIHPIMLVFSDNGFSQTQDIAFDDLNHLYAVPSGTLFTDRPSAEANLESTTRIYFYNPLEVDWDVRAHMWAYSGTNTGLNTSWPGTELTQWYMDDDQDPNTPDIATDWWYIDVQTTTSSFFLVLSDNGSVQTKDLLIYAYDELWIDLGAVDPVDGKYMVNIHLLSADEGDIGQAQ